MNTTDSTHPKVEYQPSDADHILVLTADHSSRIVPIRKTGLTIGSKPDNDIVLDDPKVAQYHARIEHENGHYRVIDLNSISGTFLGDQRLRAGIPVDWDMENTLRIGENWLGLRRTNETELDEPPTGQLLPEIDPNLIRWSAGKQVGVYVSTEQISIAPGKSGSVAIMLYNQGWSVDQLLIKVSGIPAGWVGSIPPTASVPAQAEQQVNLVIQVPQGPSARSGRHTVTVQVSSQEMPIELVEFTLTLTVLAFSRFTCALFPGTSDKDSPAVLKIENTGNLPETFSISAYDPSRKLDIRFSSDQCKLAEGETGRIEVRVTPPVDLFSASGQPYPFTLEVRSTSGQVQKVETSVMSQGLLPVWLIPLFVIGVLGLCGTALWAFAGGVGTRTQTPTPTGTQTQVFLDSDGDGLLDADELALGTDPMLADTDNDGLRDGEEQRFGTNPLVVDTDGDTLSDGREVFELHTSPINPDTDGDGLNDNVDPDPGQLPTPTAIPPTATLVPPTVAPLPPTPTAVPPLPTAIPPTATPAPPSPTAPLPTATQPQVDVSGWVAFESRRDGNLEIYMYRADNQEEQRLTNNASDDQHLAWAPSGSRMVFDSTRDGNSEIYFMHADGSGLTRLTNNPASDTFPVWSADGNTLAFLSQRDGNTEIYSMDPGGVNQVRLTNTAAEECCMQWSPLGSLIAYLSNQGGAWSLSLMNADGSSPRTLGLASALPPSWSPDGARLVFTSNRDGNSEIYALNSDGSGESRLTNNSAQDTNPLWSPNGSLVAFLSNRDGNFEVYVMSPDGSNQVRLTASGGDECCLVWSPDGMQLAFASSRDGNMEIYVVDVRNLGEVRLTENSAYDAPLAWRP